MFRTIRTKLLAVLLLFGLISIIISVLTFKYFEKNKDTLSGITGKAEKIHILLLKDLKVIHEFLENETINPSFFRSGKSSLIVDHQTICMNIKADLNVLYSLQKENNFKLDSRLDPLLKDFEEYETLCSQIIQQILIRGFKDHGVEGRMRTYAHTLENYKDEIGLINILQLRRHEKDFIIRQEDPYIEKHRLLITAIKNEMTGKKKIYPDKKSEILKVLNDYGTEFNNLIASDRRLGLKSRTGLKRRIDNISNEIETSLAQTVLFSKEQEESAIRTVKYIYISIGLFFMLIGILSAFLISRRVSQSITNLKEEIDAFVKSDFTIRTELPMTKSVNEIDVLISNFSIMEQHIVDQMNSLRQSNKDLEMLFYVTSNDIKPPLLKVKELTSHAFIKASDPESKEYLFQISRSWEKLLNITDELGIVTNIRSTVIKTELLDLVSLINSVFSELRSSQDSESIIFSLDIKTEGDFFSSIVLIKAIFRNLIDNSIKYATKRSGFSFVKISVADQNDEMLKIEVSDNGIGIRKEHQDKIFNMFYRGTSAVSGTGLGLYVVKCSLEKLNGAITVESNEDTGTTFTLILPNNYRRKNIKERIMHNREILELTNTPKNKEL